MRNSRRFFAEKEARHMPGLGTIINAAAIILGGLAGLLFGRFFSEGMQDSLRTACGVSVLFIGIGGALEGMLSVDGLAVASGRGMLVTLCLALGAFIGEAAGIEALFERFGGWLRVKTGNARDQKFVDGFVTASLTVCVGAMAIVGAVQDGIEGDCSILATKAVLDFVIILVMTCSLGKGCIFSAVPIAVFQGGVTGLARFIRPLMTEAALGNLSMIGSVLIFCVGVNLVWGKKVKTANLLPSVILAAAAAFLPFPV